MRSQCTEQIYLERKQLHMEEHINTSAPAGTSIIFYTLSSVAFGVVAGCSQPGEPPHVLHRCGNMLADWQRVESPLQAAGAPVSLQTFRHPTNKFTSRKCRMNECVCDSLKHSIVRVVGVADSVRASQKHLERNVWDQSS